MKQGITLYSLTNEWVNRQYDFESLVSQVAERDLGPGVELVGFQSIRNFPEPSQEFTRLWHSLMEKYDLVPTSLGSNVDVARRSDRLLTTEEMTDSMLRQMRVAKDLGFSIVRIQTGATADVIRQVAPKTQEWNLRLGMELHAPEGPCTPKIMGVRELYDSIGSPHLGFIPDFSATMRAVPPGYLADIVANGMPQEFADVLVTEWAADGAPFERFGRFAQAATTAGVPKAVVDSGMMAFTMFGREPIDGWREIADQVFHVHGKCYGFDAQGDEPSIDYPGLVGLLEDIGFDGYISTEWEGHSYLGPDDADSFAEVAKHQALIRRSRRA
jgi:hypothetical protein